MWFTDNIETFVDASNLQHWPNLIFILFSVSVNNTAKTLDGKKLETQLKKGPAGYIKHSKADPKVQSFPLRS